MKYNYYKACRDGLFSVGSVHTLAIAFSMNALIYKQIADIDSQMCDCIFFSLKFSLKWKWKCS